MNREKALKLLKKYNKEEYHVRHGLMVEAIMRYIIHAVCSHGYELCSDVEPTHFMEKVLYTCDELTGIIASLINMRPSHNAQGMEVATLKKKFKDKTFARGCSRDIIKKGCEMLGWDLNELFEKCIKAIEINEEQIENDLKN